MKRAATINNEVETKDLDHHYNRLCFNKAHILMWRLFLAFAITISRLKVTLILYINFIYC